MENPTGIVFSSTGFKEVTLNITRFGCTSDVTKLVEAAGVSCGKDNDKIFICHTPPGNPGNARTICINSDDIADHLAHGDCVGPCNISSKMSGIEVEEDLVTKETALSVDPNPFDNTTTVTFTISEPGKVQLGVYNYIGQQVAMLFDGYAETNKQYKAEFKIENLPEGMYFGVLQTDEGRKIIKMSLLK